jgi:hypothetical protein
LRWVKAATFSGRQNELEIGPYPGRVKKKAMAASDIAFLGLVALAPLLVCCLVAWASRVQHQRARRT